MGNFILFEDIANKVCKLTLSGHFSTCNGNRNRVIKAEESKEY